MCASSLSINATSKSHGNRALIPTAYVLRFLILSWQPMSAPAPCPSYLPPHLRTLHVHPPSHHLIQLLA
ncbi:hypothetical protein DUNSADRAFT_2406 [Dunaliella salina]|uniref:Encoded protein n=1 Tax=Dunaliella salina TaxID=3046 RepID=A0ABQ7FWC6_DUNSA|nr:hypothetical protein DUNSADRAFT_2406 [Dunaliella salina]|eukprot:KAF5826664.1 hypothetical protein DUNSADRAFT_2406 [Dunaliella salina]